MIRNYIKIAWRNLWKNKAFSLINILGLTTGFVCCLLIVLYLQHELSYDKFQQKGDRIARVIMAMHSNGTDRKGNYTGTKVLPAFVANFPEVETGVRMMQAAKVIRHGEQLYTEQRFMFADSTFFNMFSFPVVQGNMQTALDGPNKLLLTQSSAKKYFGNENPVGKTLQVGSTPVDYEITGIMEDCPSASQIKFDFLASFSSLPVLQDLTYWNANYTTYLQLKNSSSMTSLQAKIGPFMKKEMAAEMKGTDYLTYELEPFNRVHLYSSYEGFEPGTNINYIYIIGAVALLILLIACFTYINLSTARSVERAKEVGVRKVSGAGKKQIFWQFINESVVISVVALLLGVIAIQICLPAFNHLADKNLRLSSLFTPATIGIIVLIITCVSLLAGSYPAIMLSRFQPIKVLKGSFKASGSGLAVRKSLLVFQFVITIFLITATVIIQKQLYYIQHKNLGYDRDHVLLLPADAKMNEMISTIKTEFKMNPNVLSVSKTVDNPTHIRGGYSVQLPEAPDKSFPVTANPVDEEFVKTTGLKILYGTDLSQQDLKDVAGEENQVYHFMINQKAVAEFGWKPSEAVGKRMNLGDGRPGIVKAVVEDFHFASLHEAIMPLVLFPDTWGSSLLVKTSGNNLQGTVSFLEGKWKELVPQRPFEYTFLDDNFNKLYSSELRTGKVMNIFAGIAILLACMGLFGLSSYSIQQRTKEIGIRKVLGATVSSIAALLSVEFIRLVGFAFLIGVPLAWYFANKWLEDFTYRISVSWVVFAIVAIFTILFVLLAVSVQAIRAARSNPVKNLRTE